MEEVTKQVKTLLGLKDTTKADDLIQTIIEMTEARLLNLLGSPEEVPTSLLFIVTEVSVARYNRIGSEGVSSHNVEGESMSWNDNDFDAYKDDIAAYKIAQETPKRGKVRFI